LPYRVQLEREALRDLRRVPASEVRRVERALQDMVEDQFLHGSLKLSGTRAPLWRIRVGDYRLIYAVSPENETVYVQAILKRDTQTYRRLER
jgi:mRNA interferase RelE/StbE